MLLEEKLIACANIIPGVKSLYWWKESINEHFEKIVFIKTRKELESEVLKKIKKCHNYEIPATYIIDSMNEIDNEYLKWILDVTKA